MRRSQCIAFISALLLCCANAGLVIDQAKRKIDVKAQRVLHHTRLAINNDGSDAQPFATLCLPAAFHAHAAILEVGQVPSENAVEKLVAKDGWGAPADGPPDVLCASFPLLAPLKKGDSATLVLEAVLTKVLRPRPAEIKQGEPQRLLYTDTAHLVSPYVIKEERTEVDLGVDKPESHSAPAPFSVGDKTLRMGPYSGLPPFSLETFRVHYENEYPSLEATSVVREISISHWGNVYFEEKYDITHTGAKVVGEWSRLDTMLNPSTLRGAAPQIPALVPSVARWFYFRDDLGNISTSKIKEADDRTVVILSPRFPLFGGWSTKFVFGYSMPLPTAVAADTSVPGRFTLVTSILPAVKDVVVEALEVRIVLPEGATDPKITTQLKHELAEEHTYTYFDIWGRKVLVLRLKNVVPESMDSLMVSYSYSTQAMLIKPLTLSAALAAVFAAFVFMSGGGEVVAPAAKLHAN